MFGVFGVFAMFGVIGAFAVFGVFGAFAASEMFEVSWVMGEKPRRKER
jgi:hypothetical protein